MSKLHELTEMLSYMRPEGSPAQILFNEKFIEPVMGTPDFDGNYIHIEGPLEPRVSFMAHHDTVHTKSGRQRLHISTKKIVTAKKSNCLGADCTTGVWLILNMIRAKVPGLYIIHAGEEQGCIGSSAIVRRRPVWLESVDVAISFDRRGTDSIVTHQMGVRTASDEFADSLAYVLEDSYATADPTGSYTDSNEYIDLIAECTNLSVGYYDHHTQKESQDLNFAQDLLTRLIDADWSSLEIVRDPNDKSYDPYDLGGGNPYIQRRAATTQSLLAELVEEYPDQAADLLRAYGVDAAMFFEELNLMPNSHDMSRMDESELMPH